LTATAGQNEPDRQPPWQQSAAQPPPTGPPHRVTPAGRHDSATPPPPPPGRGTSGRVVTNRTAHARRIPHPQARRGVPQVTTTVPLTWLPRLFSSESTPPADVLQVLVLQAAAAEVPASVQHRMRLTQCSQAAERGERLELGRACPVDPGDVVVLGVDVVVAALGAAQLVAVQDVRSAFTVPRGPLVAPGRQLNRGRASELRRPEMVGRSRTVPL
jgi:hypothetical protein